MEIRSSRLRAIAVPIFTFCAIIHLHAQGLVLEGRPPITFLHVPASFGPDLLTLEGQVVAQKLALANPEDACQDLQNADDLKGKVALIKRGECNFTDKIYRAQQRQAIAAVVYDAHERERWGTIMSGVTESNTRITIPSVFVSHATGNMLRSHIHADALKSNSCEPAPILVSLNDTGHVKPKTKQIGPIETLATYIVVSLVLLSFFGCCGLLLALGITCHQRAFRRRALQDLEIRTYRRDSAFVSSSIRPSTTRSPHRHRQQHEEDLQQQQQQPHSEEPHSQRKQHRARASESVRRGAAIAALRRWEEARQATLPADETRQGIAGSSVSGPVKGSVEAPAGNVQHDVAASVAADLVQMLGGRQETWVGKAYVKYMLWLVEQGEDGRQASPREPGESDGEERRPAPDSVRQSEALQADRETMQGTRLCCEQSEQHTIAPTERSKEDDENALCAICLENYEEGDTLRFLPCQHSFHDACIKPWLTEKSEACPMCKRAAFRSAIDRNPGSHAGSEIAIFDELLSFVAHNVSFVAVIAVSILTTCVMLGAFAILRATLPG